MGTRLLDRLPLPTGESVLVVSTEQRETPAERTRWEAYRHGARANAERMGYEIHEGNVFDVRTVITGELVDGSKYLLELVL